MIHGIRQLKTWTPSQCAVAAEADRLGVPVANLGRRFRATAQGSYTAFSCPSCDALFGDWYLREYVMDARVDDAFLLVTFPGGSARIEEPHWCRVAGQGQCIDHEHAALTGGRDFVPAEAVVDDNSTECFPPPPARIARS